MKLTIVNHREGLFRQIESEDYSITCDDNISLKANAKPIIIVDSKNFFNKSITVNGKEVPEIVTGDELVELQLSIKDKLKEIVFVIGKGIDFITE